jgi:hypothetical protein
LAPWKTINFARSLCSNHWAKHRTTFVKVVETSLLYNFAIYTLQHFCCEISSNCGSKTAKWNEFGRRHVATPRSRARARRARASRGAPTGFDVRVPRRLTPSEVAQTEAARDPSTSKFTPSRVAPPTCLCRPRLRRPPVARRARPTVAGSPLCALSGFEAKRPRPHALLAAYKRAPTWPHARVPSSTASPLLPLVELATPLTSRADRPLGPPS